MNALMLFCAYMGLVYVPWDLFLKPVAEDQEVWFGFMFTGWAAKAMTPFHWAIYLAGAWGFWKMRSWMHPWAALYVVQVAIGMAVWSALDERSPGVWMGLVAALPFLGLAWLLWRSAPLFRSSTASMG
jgi:hypothetical protein